MAGPLLVGLQSNRVSHVVLDGASCILLSKFTQSIEDGIDPRLLLFQTVAPMDTEQPRPRIPKFQFRVLIIGRANAGKTSILQRICETTDSPIVRKRTKGRDQMEVCDQPLVCESDLIADQVTELNPSMDVSNLTLLFGCILTWYQRGEHTIDDELVFSNHQGYIFHDSRGIESGSTEELEILQEFIQRKRGEGRLRDRLHAIWFGCSSVQDADS